MFPHIILHILLIVTLEWKKKAIKRETWVHFWWNSFEEVHAGSRPASAAGETCARERSPHLGAELQATHRNQGSPGISEHAPCSGFKVARNSSADLVSRDGLCAFFTSRILGGLLDSFHQQNMMEETLFSCSRPEKSDHFCFLSWNILS